MSDLIDINEETIILDTEQNNKLSSDQEFTKMKLTKTIEICEGVLLKAMNSNTRDTSGKFMEGCATTIRSMLLAIESLNNLNSKQTNQNKPDPIVIQTTIPTDVASTKTTLSSIIEELNKSNKI